VRKGSVQGLPEQLERLLATLETLDRNDRIEMLVDVARRFRSVPERVAVRPFPKERRVPGCESEAYIWAESRPDRTLTYYFAVENPQGISAMALAAILGDSLSGVPLSDVAAVPSDIVYRIFGRELSMGKSLGLMGMVNMVRAAAMQQLQSCAQNVDGK
jgi:cysteine desulfuration protein SufE